MGCFIYGPKYSGVRENVVKSGSGPNMRGHSEVHVKQDEREHIHIHDKLTKINEKRRWEEWEGRL
jgi:hypothetical protein